MPVTNAFVGKPKPPTESDMKAELGSSKALGMNWWMVWRKNTSWRERNCYSTKAGRSLRLKRGERNIVHLSPLRGAFRASFALGDKAVQAARASGLPKPVIKLIKEAKRCPEGTAVRIGVNGPEDIPIVKRLAVIKLDH